MLLIGQTTLNLGTKLTFGIIEISLFELFLQRCSYINMVNLNTLSIRVV